MSGDLVTDVCPAYAVVDVKENVAGNVQNVDFAVVDRTRKEVSSKRNRDRKDFVNGEVTQAVREGSQLTCSTLQREYIYDVPENESSSVGDCKGLKWKSVLIISVVCSIIAIITVSLLALALGINAAISNNRIAILRAKISLVQSEAVDSFEVLQNLSVSIIDLITSGDSNLLKLINELSKNSNLTHDSLNERIKLIISATFWAIKRIPSTFMSGNPQVTYFRLLLGNIL